MGRLKTSGEVMTHRKDLSNDLSPRSGRSENSPALQCWVSGEVVESEPVKRATEMNRLIKFCRVFQSSASRTGIWNTNLSPSDKSLGYFQPSAPRTILMSLAFATLVMACANCSVLAQVPASSSPSPTPEPALTVPTMATGFHANASKPLPPITRVGVDTSEQKP